MLICMGIMNTSLLQFVGCPFMEIIGEICSMKYKVIKDFMGGCDT